MGLRHSTFPSDSFVAARPFRIKNSKTMNFLKRLKALFRKRELDNDMDAEMRSHIEFRTQANLEAGMNPEEARYAALRRFGSSESLKETCRDHRGARWLDNFFQDLRYAARQLRKNAGFTTVVVLTLAGAIGANTAIFSLVNEVLLRSLPVKNPGELVLFRAIEGPGGRLSWAGEDRGFTDPNTGRFSSTSFSLLIFERFRAHHPALSDVAAFAPFSDIHLVIDREAESGGILGQFVSGNYHGCLGVPPILGRTITPDDDQPSAEPVVVISHRYWQNRFGGNPGVIGKTIELNKIPATIIGITPPGFAGAMQIGESADISVPLAHHARFQPGPGAGRAQPWYWWIRIMGRLAPGATPAQAGAGLESTFQETAREGWRVGRPLNPETVDDMPGPPTLVVDPGGQGENDTRREYRRPLRTLMGLAALVLLAACANVANLLLARGAARRREIAVRLAVGAGRARIVRPHLAESVMLASLGAAFGSLFALWSRGPLLDLRQFGGFPAVLDLPLDGRVLSFTIAAAAATALLFGLVPALRATRVNLSAEFHGGARQLGAGARSRLSQSLMVLQIALSLVLLVSTGLFVRTLRNLKNIDPGFNTRQLALFHIDATSAGYKSGQVGALRERLRERLESIPGVRAATFSDIALLAGDRENADFFLPGHTPAGLPNGTAEVDVNGVALNFFATMEIPLAFGRNFDAHDIVTAPKVAIVNQAFSRKFFGDENPVGNRLGRSAAKAADIEIIGVVADTKYRWLRETAPATVYFPLSQAGNGTANCYVRTTVTPQAEFAAIRAVVREIDPLLPVMDLRTQTDQIDRLNAQEHLFARLSGFFGIVALALACVGLYGLMSCLVLRRTGEIGLRMALGALPAQVLRMILRESLGLVAFGLVLGFAGAYGAGRLVQSMLFDLSPADPLTYGSVALILIAVALLASLLPARRAARVDPMSALRQE